jgi:hypothetical protein
MRELGLPFLATTTSAAELSPKESVLSKSRIGSLKNTLKHYTPPLPKA